MILKTSELKNRNNPIRIQINKRIVTQDFRAQVENRPSTWGVGESREEAIGNLIYANPDFFKIEIIEVSYIKNALDRRTA